MTKKALENIVGKGSNTGNHNFLLCLQCFPAYKKKRTDFESHLFCRLQILSTWTSLKFGNVLNSCSPICTRSFFISTSESNTYVSAYTMGESNTVVSAYTMGESNTVVSAYTMGESNTVVSAYTMGESNTVVSAYTMFRHLQQYCSHPSI